MSVVGEFVIRCFHARTLAHVLHLRSRSYAQHIALNEFYDGLIPLVDSFVEAYQGDYGIIDDIAGPYRDTGDALTLLSNLSDWIEARRSEICDEDDSYLQNIVDEIVALIRSTQYKLRFLK